MSRAHNQLDGPLSPPADVGVPVDQFVASIDEIAFGLAAVAYGSSGLMRDSCGDWWRQDKTGELVLINVDDVPGFARDHLRTKMAEIIARSRVRT